MTFQYNQNEVTTAAEELIGGGDHFDDIPRSSHQTTSAHRIFLDIILILPRNISQHLYYLKSLLI
jgi:hypothetical protein